MQPMLFQSDPHFVGMDNYYTFFGVVENRDDPLRLGRCKVRIIGIHPDQNSTSTDNNIVTTDDLPWAYPIMPILNSPAGAASGWTPVGPAVGTHVIGFFADGMDRQIPMIFGTLSGGDGQFKSETQGANVGNSNFAVDPNYANSPTNLNGNVTQKGVECAKIFMQLAKKSSKFNNFQDYHVAAIMGNIAIESGFRAVYNGNFRTDSDTPPKVGERNRPYNGRSSAYGFCQWIGPRMDNFITYCNTYRVDPRTPTANIGFLISEIEKSYPQIINAVNSGGTHTSSDSSMRGPWNISQPDGAGMTGYFCGEFERPGADGPTSYPKRLGYTRAILAGLRNTNVPSRGAAR